MLYEQVIQASNKSITPNHWKPRAEQLSSYGHCLHILFAAFMGNANWIYVIWKCCTLDLPCSRFLRGTNEKPIWWLLSKLKKLFTLPKTSISAPNILNILIIIGFENWNKRSRRLLCRRLDDKLRHYSFNSCKNCMNKFYPGTEMKLLFMKTAKKWHLYTINYRWTEERMYFLDFPLQCLQNGMCVWSGFNP